MTNVVTLTVNGKPVLVMRTTDITIQQLLRFRKIEAMTRGIPMEQVSVDFCATENFVALKKAGEANR